MANTEGGGPELISLRELARRLVAEGVVEKISRQRVVQLAEGDPGFPPVTQIGRSKAVDWRLAVSYFRDWQPQPGRRTDLERKRADAESDGPVGGTS